MERNVSAATAAFLGDGVAPRLYAARSSRPARPIPTAKIADLGYAPDDKRHPDHAFALRDQLLGPIEEIIVEGLANGEVRVETQRNAAKRVEYGPVERYLVIDHDGHAREVEGRPSELQRSFPDQEEAHRRIVAGMYGPRPAQAIFRIAKPEAAGA
jgi:hypothetical protein